MRKSIIIIAAILLIGCKKENKCYTCSIKEYRAADKKYFATGKYEDFCGTEKELKVFVEHKLTQGRKLECSN